MRRITIGVIGCGKQAEDTHLPNLISIPEAKLVALSDINQERLGRLGKEYNINKLYSDYNELLELDLDAVVICTPTPTHATVARTAAMKKKHVFIEKPIAMTVEDAKSVLDAADMNHVKMMVGFQMRFLPNHIKVREMIRSGRIGRILIAEVHSETLQIKPEDGILLDYGIHFFDLLRWYFQGNEVVEVSAVVGKSDRNQFTTVTLKFSNETIGHLSLYWVPSYASWERVERYVRFIGENGKITTDQSSPVIRLYKPGTLLSRTKGYHQIMLPFAIHPSLPISATTYRRELEEFINAVRQDRPASISAYDGLMAIKIAEAARESSQTGNSVRIIA